MREISEKECGTLKGAVYRAIRQAGGGGNVQHSTRVSEATLSRYHSTDERNAENFAPLDICVELDRLAQSPIICAAYAKLLGFRLVPDDAPETVKPAAPITTMDALAIANEAADVVKAITEALANDGVIDLAEGRIITRESDELARVIHDVLARVGVRR